MSLSGWKCHFPCTGTMRVRSIDFDHIIDVKTLYFSPPAQRNPMPAFQFVAKGCELKYKGDTVTLIDQEKHPVLCGKEFMDCTTFTVNPSVSPHVAHSLPPDMQSAALFCLPVSKNISAKSVDLSCKLLEAHWCYGPCTFDKLRKLFGSVVDPTPTALCAPLPSKATCLALTTRTRSDRPCHRMRHGWVTRLGRITCFSCM
jgi:hypothetical protein